ncbi:reverse transcriptase domain-containing protein [Tanacetum coccineum]|uniref:Reverse transcriptase domain-containing protein n=1 Tax=Tanacetum coccineum TaxID=301880 RepID=A0ABQ5BNP9_9ASTR
MKSRITPNPRRQPPEQSQKGGMEIGALEARHRLPVSLKDSNKIDLLHLSPGRGRRVVCSTGWEEKNEVHLHVLTASIRVPTKRKPRCNQGSIIIGALHPGKLADIQRVKTVREVTGSPNQENTCQTPTKMISLSLGRVRKETLSHLVSGISISQGQGCPATLIHMMEAEHLKLFQATAKTERWAMPTWCHMFNSTLTGNARVWFDKLPRESIDSYEDLRTAFRENYLQQKNIIQGSGGDTSYQAKRWRIHGGLYGKIQSRNPGCGRSAGMHEDLRIHARYNPPRADQAFIQENSEVNGMKCTGDYVFSANGEVAASSLSRKKHPANRGNSQKEETTKF